MNKVTVIGSINLDRTIRVARMAKPGETLHTKEIFTAGGGKGANQAIAAQRLGADTSFIGAVGEEVKQCWSFYMRMESTARGSQRYPIIKQVKHS